MPRLNSISQHLFTVNKGTVSGGGGTPIPNNPAPVYVNSATGLASSTNSQVFTNYPSISSGNLLLLVSGAENPDAQLSSIVGTGSLSGLTWNSRSVNTNITGYASTKMSLEVWWAFATTTGSVNTLTLTYNKTFDDQGAILAQFSGCNVTNPWQTLSPVINTGVGNGVLPATVSNFATDRNNSLGIWISGTASATYLSPGGSWPNRAQVTNNGASYWEYINLSTQTFAIKQSGLALTTSPSAVGANVGYIAYADALVG